MSGAAGTKINWNGKSWYLQGANIPWYKWACDFGCGANGGVSSAASKTAIGATLKTAKASGVDTLRWWMFEGQPWQITTDSAGNPAGINPAVTPTSMRRCRLAQANDQYIDFVLFSSPTAIPSQWITDPTARTKLSAVLGQLFAHYKGNNRILAWEVFNEPEFDIWNGKIDQASVQATVKSVAASVHTNSTAYVTVGSAMMDGLSMWVGLGLDFYQAHWYDYMSSGNYCARCTDYATAKSTYGLDRPLVIGEFFGGASVDAFQRDQDFYNKGYAGGWAWSLFPGSTSDGMRCGSRRIGGVLEPA